MDRSRLELNPLGVFAAMNALAWRTIGAALRSTSGTPVFDRAGGLLLIPIGIVANGSNTCW